MAASEKQVQFGDIDLSAAFDFLEVFFDSGLPKEHRKDLKKWRYHIINAEQYSGRYGAGHLFNVYEEVLQLIEAADTLMRLSETPLASIVITEDDIQQEKRNWVYFPVNLSRKAYVNPFIAIRKFFKEITAAQYKDLLHEWLRIALSNKPALETLSAREIIDVYDNIRKLYSAVWLIHQRTSKTTICK